MSFLRTSTTPEVLAVHTVNGKLWVGTDHFPKARVWLLDGREAVLCTPGAAGAVERRTEALVASSWDPRTKVLTAETTDGRTIRLDGKGCGCNMGVVGNAGPLDGPYRITRVRTPDWHTVLS